MPSFVLNSKRFHQILYRFLIGSWFNLDFRKEYKKYTEEDWRKLYDLLFENRIREDDLTGKQKKYILQNILGSTVLDIGCGTGTMIEEILRFKKVTKIAGNEISRKAIDYLKNKFRRFSKVKFKEGDFLKTEFKEKVDTVLCLHVLEHIKDIKRMANKMKKIARRRIIVIVPNEKFHPYSPNYHLHFFNEKNPVMKFFPKRKNILKIIDGDYVLVSDK